MLISRFVYLARPTRRVHVYNDSITWLYSCTCTTRYFVPTTAINVFTHRLTRIQFYAIHTSRLPLAGRKIPPHTFRIIIWYIYFIIVRLILFFFLVRGHRLGWPCRENEKNGTTIVPPSIDEHTHTHVFFDIIQWFSFKNFLITFFNSTLIL